jgi:transcription elongation factor GreA
MPDMKRSPITKEGYVAIREELERLKKHERPKIIAAIEEARGHGDLSENAEYLYAKERQAFIEARMQDLENKLGNAEIIDTSKLPADRIVFGTTFILCNIETEEEIRYQIVGVDESDIKQGKISVESPMAKALIGKKISDEVIVDTPNGKREYGILEIVRN